jgi:hypothetical protein
MLLLYSMPQVVKSFTATRNEKKRTFFQNVARSEVQCAGMHVEIQRSSLRVLITTECCRLTYDSRCLHQLFWRMPAHFSERLLLTNQRRRNMPSCYLRIEAAFFALCHRVENDSAIFTVA